MPPSPQCPRTNAGCYCLRSLLVSRRPHRQQATSTITTTTTTTTTTVTTNNSRQVEIIKECFISAGERNLYTGDNLEIFIMTKDGLRKEVFALKAD